MSKVNLIRVIYEADGRVNLAHAVADLASAGHSVAFEYHTGKEVAWTRSARYFNLDVMPNHEADYNCNEEELPEILTEKLAVLKLAPTDANVGGVGFKNNFRYVNGAEFSIVEDIYYVEADFFVVTNIIREGKDGT